MATIYFALGPKQGMKKFGGTVLPVVFIQKLQLTGYEKELRFVGQYMMKTIWLSMLLATMRYS
ncbi:hypothetical protein F180042I2_06940 [Enterocloster bolteae]